MKRITYSLYNRNGEKTKTVEVYEKDPIFLALETYINGEQTPQYISELDKSTITWLLERLIIATDLGDKRWKALNEIYEQAASGNTDWHWRHRKAGEGLGLKEEIEE